MQACPRVHTRVPAAACHPPCPRLPMHGDACSVCVHMRVQGGPRGGGSAAWPTHMHAASHRPSAAPVAPSHPFLVHAWTTCMHDASHRPSTVHAAPSHPLLGCCMAHVHACHVASPQCSARCAEPPIPGASHRPHACICRVASPRCSPRCTEPPVPGVLHGPCTCTMHRIALMQRPLRRATHSWGVAWTACMHDASHHPNAAPVASSHSFLVHALTTHMHATSHRPDAAPVAPSHPFLVHALTTCMHDASLHPSTVHAAPSHPFLGCCMAHAHAHRIASPRCSARGTEPPIPGVLHGPRACTMHPITPARCMLHRATRSWGVAWPTRMHATSHRPDAAPVALSHPFLGCCMDHVHARCIRSPQCSTRCTEPPIPGACTDHTHACHVTLPRCSARCAEPPIPDALHRPRACTMHRFTPARCMLHRATRSWGVAWPVHMHDASHRPDAAPMALSHPFLGRCMAHVHACCVASPKRGACCAEPPIAGALHGPCTCTPHHIAPMQRPLC